MAILNNWDQTEYPDNNVDPDVPDDMRKMAVSLSGRVNTKFSSLEARDAAFTALGADLRRGTIAHVLNKGLYYFTGIEWKRIGSRGDYFTQGLTSVVNTDAAGRARVSFLFNYTGIPTVVATHTANPEIQSPPIILRTTADAFNSFVVDAVNPNGSAYVGNFTFAWIAWGPWDADG
jgi:hypothetical protein